MAEPTLEQILEDCTERCRTMNAPLDERLALFAAEVRRVHPGFADVVERMIDRLRQAGAGSDAPAPGEPMPEFLLPDETGRLRSLAEFTDSGPLVVAFHRGHWCPYCLINATALSEIHPEIVARGGALVAITPEIERFSGELKAQAGAKFPVLSDIDNG